MPQAASINNHPPVGTLIDDDTLELVEVLGVGGYGVAYRAVDIRSPFPKSYAVKCLAHSTQQQHSSRRQFHIQEIALHQLASAHRNVVTLHRVVEDYNYTYLIMDFAPDGDLFTQILNECRYLGDNALIKHVFMQLIDAVDYCHSLGIYHRDLKPENILCFDGGYRVALTDFGLATTDKLSHEFRTGSVYHMSPECQDGSFAPGGAYSPMYNDIWSLGIILLNLATGRNPWKSATVDDPTFQAYLRDPARFLPTVLPISSEINEVLVRMLEVNYPDRITLQELRVAMQDVHNFYSDGVIFEGSMARCPWEVGMEIDSDPSTKKDIVPRGVPAMKSHWSKDSEIIFAKRSIAEQSFEDTWTAQGSQRTWAMDSEDTSHYHLGTTDPSCIATPPSTRRSSMSRSPSESSLPVTPNAYSMAFPQIKSKPKPRLKPLAIDTHLFNTRPAYYNGSYSDDSPSPRSSMMQTAVETPNASIFRVPSVMSCSGASGIFAETIDMVTTAATEDKIIAASIPWGYGPTHADFPSPSRSADRLSDESYNSPITPSPEVVVWSGSIPWRTSPVPVEVPKTPPPPPSPPTKEPITLKHSEPISSPTKTTFLTKKPQQAKPRSSSIFSSMKLFPRNSPTSTHEQPPSPAKPVKRGRRSTYPYPLYSKPQEPPPPLPTFGTFQDPLPAQPQPAMTRDRNTRRTPYFRSPRTWLFPRTKFFSIAAGS
ncbi:hypothetical protein AX16_004417 [Volvariella volvacea WC 439]|nr:hypothetical protein AX16_004417 [Volvariella volvacea WC 439]